MGTIKTLKTAWIAVTVIALCLPVLAEVKVVLTANKIVVVDGKEQMQPSDKAKPGEVIEYVAEYRNTDKAAVTNVIATLPVPAGMEFLPETAQPQQLTASTDEHNFAPVPLKRKVSGPDGKTVEQLVPFSEYRSLRWTLGQIPGGGSKSVKARMKVKAAN
ncbi:MAG TPA: hypothetical protein VI685_05560 [Candidatus Angelobacter sp.]